MQKYRAFVLSYLFLALLAFGPLARAVEVDDISASQVELKDSVDVLNQKVRDVLVEAALATESCNMRTFEKQVLAGLTPEGLINRTFFGGIERFAIESPDIERYETTLDESIYKGTPLARAFFVVAGKWFRIGQIFPSIRLNGQTVGTDKLSHFFETGHAVYKETLKENTFKTLSPKQIENLVREAIRLEDENLGLQITGIKSFGDMHAHLQGALFWKALLSADGGWVSCENQKLVITQTFDFRNIVQPGWSEAINCNVYAEGPEASSLFDSIRGPAPSFVSVIKTNTQQLEAKTGHRYTCPVIPQSCITARDRLQKYDLRLTPYLDSLMSPSCAKPAL